MIFTPWKLQKITITLRNIISTAIPRLAWQARQNISKLSSFRRSVANCDTQSSSIENSFVFSQIWWKTQVVWFVLSGFALYYMRAFTHISSTLKPTIQSWNTRKHQFHSSPNSKAKIIIRVCYYYFFHSATYTTVWCLQLNQVRVTNWEAITWYFLFHTRKSLPFSRLCTSCQRGEWVNNCSQNTNAIFSSSSLW